MEHTPHSSRTATISGIAVASYGVLTLLCKVFESVLVEIRSWSHLVGAVRTYQYVLRHLYGFPRWYLLSV